MTAIDTIPTIDFTTVTKLNRNGLQNTIRRGTKWYDFLHDTNSDKIKYRYLSSLLGKLQIYSVRLKPFCDIPVEVLLCNYSVALGMSDIDVYDYILEQMRSVYPGFEEGEMCSVVWFQPVERI